MHGLVSALTVTRMRGGVERGRKEAGLRVLRGHHSIPGQGSRVWPPGTPWGAPHLGAAAFPDPAGVRPVGDPHSLGSGERREVEWAGSRPGCEETGDKNGGWEDLSSKRSSTCCVTLGKSLALSGTLQEGTC